MIRKLWKRESHTFKQRKEKKKGALELKTVINPSHVFKIYIRVDSAVPTDPRHAFHHQPRCLRVQLLEIHNS